MGFKDWLTKNTYVTSPLDKDPFFHPRRYRKPKAEVVQAAQEVLRFRARWKMEEYRENQGRIHATRKTRVLGFVDDVNIYIVQGQDGITRLEITSQSRVGKGDLGQNRRNIQEFLRGLDLKLPPIVS